MKGVFQFIGTGASAGVPIIGCKCPTCRSDSAKDKRFRPSGVIRAGGKTLLIDIGPDFRSQALQYGIDTLDGILLTHTHYDHIAGIDEVRIFNVRQKQAIPCLLSPESYEEMRKRYDYFFNPEGLSAKVDFVVLKGDQVQTEFLGLKVGNCSFTQGNMKVTGFRLGDFAYVSDIHKYEESIFSSLEGVRTLVLSALRPETNPFHLSFKQAEDFAKRVGAQETWITHVGHFLPHEKLQELLPSQMNMAYDGLKLEFSCTN